MLLKIKENLQSIRKEASSVIGNDSHGSRFLISQKEMAHYFLNSGEKNV